MTNGRSPAPGAGGGLVDDLEADGDLVGVDLDEVRDRPRLPTGPPPPPPPPPSADVRELRRDQCRLGCASRALQVELGLRGRAAGRD